MKNILLVGLGRFGLHTAMKLHELGHMIMAVDKNEERVNRALPYTDSTRIGDAAQEDFLKTLGVDDYDLCIVAIGDDFQNSLIVTSRLKEFGAKVVVSRAGQDIQRQFLLKNGADYVVYPEREMAEWAAVRFSSDHILDYHPVGTDAAVIEIDMPKTWVGKTVKELRIRQDYNLNIVGIRHDDKVSLHIDPDVPLLAGDNLLVLGTSAAVQKCYRKDTL